VAGSGVAEMTLVPPSLCVARVTIHADAGKLAELEQALLQSLDSGTSSFLEALLPAPDVFCLRLDERDSELYEKSGFESLASWRVWNWGTSSRDHLASVERRGRTLVATFVTPWSLPDPGLCEIAGQHDVKMYVDWYDNILSVHGRRCYPDGLGEDWFRAMAHQKPDEPAVAAVIARVRGVEL